VCFDAVVANVVLSLLGTGNTNGDAETIVMDSIVNRLSQQKTKKKRLSREMVDAIKLGRKRRADMVRSLWW